MHNRTVDISVCMITYNHEKYIEQAIRSVFSQEGDFNLELVIGIDHSEDNTFSICKKMKDELCTENKTIKIITSSERVGMSRNLQRTLGECNGKYIAFLEGDDYWTLTDKLLRQKHFLDKNSNVDICSTLFSTYLVEKDETSNPDENKSNKLFKISIDHASIQNPFGTLTVMVRNNNAKIPNWIWDMPFIDWPLYCFFLAQNKIGYILNLNTATYRFHNNGVFGSKKGMDVLNNTNIILSNIKKGFSYVLNKKTLRLLDRKIYQNKKNIFYLNKQDNGMTIKTLTSLFYLLRTSISDCNLKESKSLINYFLFH